MQQKHDPDQQAKDDPNDGQHKKAPPTSNQTQKDLKELKYESTLSQQTCQLKSNRPM